MSNTVPIDSSPKQKGPVSPTSGHSPFPVGANCHYAANPLNQFKAVVARLVDAEQRAAHRDLAYQAPPVGSAIQMGVGTEQPVAEGAGCFQVGGGETQTVASIYVPVSVEIRSFS
jgi:hypothetical protein